MRGLLARLFPERRYDVDGAQSISQNPSQPLLAALGMPMPAAGLSVSEQTADAIPAVYACDRVLKQGVAMTPLKLFRVFEDGSKKIDTTRELYGVLHDLANPVMTAFEFREAMQSSLNLWGNAYAEIVRYGNGEVKELWPLDAWRMTVDLDGLNHLRYRYRRADGSEQVWWFNPNTPPVLHLRINARDGIHGRSPVRVLREAMAWALATQQYGAAFFGNSGTPKGVLTVPGPLKELQKSQIKKAWDALYQGVDRSNQVAVLSDGATFAPVAIPNDDAQFLETMKFHRSVIAGIFGVPSHLINDLERATFSNIEHQSLDWLAYGLGPHLDRWEQALNRDLLNRKSFNSHRILFIRDAVVRHDIKTRNEALQLQRQNGIINGNEWRRMTDQNPIEDDEVGNAYLVNGNMIPVTSAADPAEAGTDDPLEAPLAPTPTDDTDDRTRVRVRPPSPNRLSLGQEETA